MSRFQSSAQGKAKFITLCREAASTNTHVYIRDSSGKPALTIDPHECPDAYSVAAQFFKDNFARCAALAKTGLVFRVQPKSAAAVWVRRHTRYVDPLDDAVQQWLALHRKRGAEELLGRALKKIEKIDRIDDLAAEITCVRKGIERINIGHRPFTEGQLPDAIA